MKEEWVSHISMGAGVAILASLALLLMVYRELAPTGGLSGRGRLLLTAGVGLGVLSFATKVAALAVMVAFPEVTIVPLSSLHRAERHAPAPGPYDDRRTVPAKSAYVWQALPEFGSQAGDDARVALGWRLFNDKHLSRDGSIACASCHDVMGAAGIDRRATSEGIGGQVGSRNAPTVWNAAYQSRLFWDGRAPSLEEQAKGPPVNPIEMGMHDLDQVAARVAQDPSYRLAFAALSGTGQPIGIDDVVGAIAAYERTLVTPDSSYDRYVRGDHAALDGEQERGMELFETTGCVICHHGPNFSSASVFDARMPYRLFPAFRNDYVTRFHLDRDLGRAGSSGQRGVWRVPSLRNVALTAPYFHNGRVEKLEDAVRVMAVSQLGCKLNEQIAAEPEAKWVLSDGVLHRVPHCVLTGADVRAIAAFLRSLSSARLETAMRAATEKSEL